MDDADIDDPFNPNDSHGGASTTTTDDSGPSQDLIDNVAAMDFLHNCKESVGIEQ